MRALNIIWMFAAGIAVAAALGGWLGRTEPPGEREAVGAPVSEHAAQARRDPTPPRSAPDGAETRSTAAPAGQETAAAPDASVADAAAALQAELQAMSEGYRNRVFLQAIRQRGHYCDGVLDTQLGRGDVAAWRVACRGTEAYLIGADAGGRLVVEPLYYGDPTAIQLVPGEDAPRRRQPVLPVLPENE